MNTDVSKELAVYPCLLIGGTNHGTTYLMHDRPYRLCAPERREISRAYYPGIHGPVEADLRVEEYIHSEARVQGFDTPWTYYRHSSLDDGAGMFALWSFLWEAASKLSRVGGWQRDKRCYRCEGSGLDPSAVTPS